MSYPERQRVREVRFVSMCGSPVFWGIVLLTVGVFGLLPHVSRYVWPIIAIAAGAWLLFGPFVWYREQPPSLFEDEDPFDTF